MKKWIFIIAIMLIGYVASAQRGKIYEITPDTITEVETELFSTDRISGTYQSLTMNLVLEELGGTTEGSAIFEGSLDGTSWNTLNTTTGKYTFFPNDTLTMTDGATWLVIITEPALQYYRFSATGTANDTTLITPKWSLK